MEGISAPKYLLVCFYDKIMTHCKFFKWLRRASVLGDIGMLIFIWLSILPLGLGKADWNIRISFTVRPILSRALNWSLVLSSVVNKFPSKSNSRRESWFVKVYALYLISWNNLAGAPELWVENPPILVGCLKIKIRENTRKLAPKNACVKAFGSRVSGCCFPGVRKANTPFL